MSDLDRLEKLAREASRDWHSKTPTMPLREYHAAANPSVVLDLIARVKAAEAEAKAVFRASYGLSQERDAYKARLDAVASLASQWDGTPDYQPTDYDRGRVDQRHEMTMQLLETLDGDPTG